MAAALPQLPDDSDSDYRSSDALTAARGPGLQPKRPGRLAWPADRNPVDSGPERPGGSSSGKGPLGP